MSKPNENEIKEMIEAGITLGRIGAAVFRGGNAGNRKCRNGAGDSKAIL